MNLTEFKKIGIQELSNSQMQQTNGGDIIRLLWQILRPTPMGTGDTPNTNNGDNGIPSSGGPPPNPTPPTCDNV